MLIEIIMSKTQYFYGKSIYKKKISSVALLLEIY